MTTSFNLAASDHLWVIGTLLIYKSTTKTVAPTKREADSLGRALRRASHRVAELGQDLRTVRKQDPLLATVTSKVSPALAAKFAQFTPQRIMRQYVKVQTSKAWQRLGQEFDLPAMTLLTLHQTVTVEQVLEWRSQGIRSLAWLQHQARSKADIPQELQIFLSLYQTKHDTVQVPPATKYQPGTRRFSMNPAPSPIILDVWTHQVASTMLSWDDVRSVVPTKPFHFEVRSTDIARTVRRIHDQGEQLVPPSKSTKRITSASVEWTVDLPKGSRLHHAWRWSRDASFRIKAHSTRSKKRVDGTGDGNCQSNWSGHQWTVLDVAKAAKARGYSTVCLMELANSSSFCTGNLQANVKKFLDECAAASKKTGVKVRSGVEICPTVHGNLPWPKDVLDQFDHVLLYVPEHQTNIPQRYVAGLAACTIIRLPDRLRLSDDLVYRLVCAKRVFEIGPRCRPTVASQLLYASQRIQTDVGKRVTVRSRAASRATNAKQMDLIHLAESNQKKLLRT